MTYHWFTAIQRVTVAPLKKKTFVLTTARNPDPARGEILCAKATEGEVGPGGQGRVLLCGKPGQQESLVFANKS